MLPFLSSKDVILKSHDSIQQKKFNVVFKSHQPKDNPGRVIFNYSKISLSDAQNSLLVKKKLQFSLPLKKLSYADFLANFELFNRSIPNLLDVFPNGDLDFVKTKVKETVLSSFCFYNANVPQKFI